ncbi:UV DNA damage repair endonuclease UvsE [Jeotgalibaca arthritidis]|uniref:UV DNA damage repair endonuclease UvsE n=1 Tax=Jeotgalibaca arthritidis TaxID=1868794 RepID=A0A6G7KAW0_9LACT|nr:UV DNA damage repair endonuclease UvsE [Jeotgalibaca arthritidis]QII82377.1 UV DNA damage repair endonuclease UvsE [Jeotgalibaca arthritidis]
MSIGYACLQVGRPDTTIRSVIQKNATTERLMEVIDYNLQSFENMIDYNIKNKIKLYRISSGLIPFGSSPVNQLDWEQIFHDRFITIGQKIKQSGMRVSFHPGQYTVLNSPDEGVVSRAVDDLVYQEKILTLLGVDYSHKLILHVGGVYGDKVTALERFEENVKGIPQAVKNRLIIENDDRLFNVEDVLGLAHRIGIPVVYDNLHNAINPADSTKDDGYWISEARKTWKPEDGNQKIHYSQQASGKRLGAHTDTIYIEDFLEFYNKLEDKTIDIMLEVKDKNLSSLKCQNATTDQPAISLLEKEWGRYKYFMLEKSPRDYQVIRQLLKDKTAYPVLEFYRMIEAALEKETDSGAAINTAHHIWGYFKGKATKSEQATFIRNCTNYQSGKAKLATVKRQLHKLAIKYDQTYLIESLYFYIED